MLDYENDHYCPAYGKEIDIDLCYDSMMCLTGMFKIESTKELLEIKDIPAARKKCMECPYSKLTVEEQ